MPAYDRIIAAVTKRALCGILAIGTALEVSMRTILFGVFAAVVVGIVMVVIGLPQHALLGAFLTMAGFAVYYICASLIRKRTI